MASRRAAPTIGWILAAKPRLTRPAPTRPAARAASPGAPVYCPHPPTTSALPNVPLWLNDGRGGSCAASAGAVASTVLTGTAASISADSCQIHVLYPADQAGSGGQIETQLRRPGGDRRIGSKRHGIGLSAVAVNAAGHVHGDGAWPRAPARVPDGGEYFLSRPAQGWGGADAQDRINDHAGRAQPRGEPVAGRRRSWRAGRRRRRPARPRREGPSPRSRTR